MTLIDVATADARYLCGSWTSYKVKRSKESHIAS